MTTEHKFRSGDVVAIVSPSGVEVEETMVVLADYESGKLFPACAADQWSVPIDSARLVRAASDLDHNRVLDRFANGLSKGLRLPAAERALGIYRPKGAPLAIIAVRENDDEGAVFTDLARKAGDDAAKAATRVAMISEPGMAPGILLAAAQYLTNTACLAFAVSLTRRASDDVKTLATRDEIRDVVTKAWAIADVPEAERTLAVGLAEIAGRVGAKGAFAFAKVPE